MKGGSMQSEACRWRWTFREEGGGTRSGGQEWPVEASRRATVLAFSPPLSSPPPSLPPLLNRFYEQKSGKLLRLEIDSTSPRNRRILPVSQFPFYLFTALRAWKITLVRSIPESFGRDIEFFRKRNLYRANVSFFFFSFLVRKFESNNNDRFEIISLLIKFFRSDRGEERRKEERKKNNFPRVIESSWHGG